MEENEEEIERGLKEVEKGKEQVSEEQARYFILKTNEPKEKFRFSPSRFISPSTESTSFFVQEEDMRLASAKLHSLVGTPANTKTNSLPALAALAAVATFAIVPAVVRTVDIGTVADSSSVQADYMLH